MDWTIKGKTMAFYALHDFDKSKPGMFLIKPEEAKNYNLQGYGIHWCPQEFKDDVRKTENLIKIQYWLADIDTGDKQTMLRRIASLPVEPTHVVETKRGYHCYWRAKDATPENYATIEKGIAEALCADGSLITPTHTLRFPGFWHLKDPTQPFLVNWVWKKPENIYSEALMLRCFKPRPKVVPRFAREISSPITVDLQTAILPENWDKILHANLATPGNRNNQMNKIAYHLKMLGADKSLMLRVLLEINETRNIGLDFREINSIVSHK
jgi:hypothetical protein